MTLLAIDPGHGAATAGKRSPATLGLPILREYQFSRDMAWALEQELDRCGISHMRTVTSEADPRPSARAKVAAAAGCKILVSLHANAGGGTGIETFHYEHSDSGARLARLVQEDVIAVTGMRDREVQTKITVKGKLCNPGICVEASIRGMAGVIVECGFMDYGPDLAKLRDHGYKIRCAAGIARGICRYIGVPYKGD